MLFLAHADDGSHGRPLARFAWTVVAVLFALVTIGGVVTASDSGLGCGQQWPTCAGHLLPPDSLSGVLEWTHRLVAGVASVLTVLLAVLVWRRAPSSARSRPLRRVSVAMVAVLALQVVLGGLVVLTGIPPWLIALHEGAALLLLDVVLAAALLLSLQQETAARPARRTALGTGLWLLAGWAGATAMLGSYLAHTGAACPAFGACLAVLAHEGGPFGAGLWHWLAALLLGGGSAVLLLHRDRLPERARRWLWAALAALGCQALLGVWLLNGLSPVLLALHEAVGMAAGALLWGTASAASILRLGASDLSAATCDL